MIENPQNENPKNGISFMVRVRNEEATLEQSILSLFPLTIPYEIILVLHLCTDRSEEIALQLQERNPRVKVYKYDLDISRPGYETLATDKQSPHSIMTYYNWCKSKTTMPWIFKWDGDFIASPGLLRALQERSWHPQNKQIKIHCKGLDMDTAEPYLIGNLTDYGKFLFWEIPNFQHNGEIETLPREDAIMHASTLQVMKSYWTRVPWYETEDSEEAKVVKDRMKQLVRDFGEEPVGACRCCNEESHSYYFKIKRANPSYVNFYD